MDSRDIIHSLFGVPRALIGVIHAQALPGTPASRDGVSAIAKAAAAEAEIYAAAGFHGLILENTNDRPYLKGAAIGPEIVAAMSLIGAEIRRASPLPLGIQVLAGANRAAIAVAHACGAAFVRVEGFVFAHVADEGIIESSAGDLLRYRRAIGADDVLVFADIKKKHSAHAITADVDIAETAKAAEFFFRRRRGGQRRRNRKSRRSGRGPGGVQLRDRADDHRLGNHGRKHRSLSRRRCVHRRLIGQERWSVVRPTRCRADACDRRRVVDVVSVALR